MKKPEKEKIDFNKYNLKPASSYLNDIPDFAKFMDNLEKAEKTGRHLDSFQEGLDEAANFSDFLDVMKEAEKAADELLRETEEKKTAKTVTHGKEPVSDGVKAEEVAEEIKKPNLDELMKELDSLVGLEKIKSNVKSLINLVKVRKLREENGLPTPPLSLHLVFMGNPGTGKTTVARLISKLYNAIGVLSKGQLIEVDRSGLVAGYVGQTAIKTGEVIKSAMGGVLFIDEAYSLASGGGEGTADFGREAIETILKAMEDNRDDLVVIVAGYENLMEKFISSNPGLESRFNRYFLFEDYNAGELMKIFESMCVKNQYALDEEAATFAEEHFKYLYDTRDDNFGNARDVRNLFENIVSVQADRLAVMEAPTKDDLVKILKCDIEKAAEM